MHQLRIEPLSPDCQRSAHEADSLSQLLSDYGISTSEFALGAFDELLEEVIGHGAASARKGVSAPWDAPRRGEGRISEGPGIFPDDPRMSASVKHMLDKCLGQHGRVCKSKWRNKTLQHSGGGRGGTPPQNKW